MSHNIEGFWIDDTLPENDTFVEGYKKGFKDGAKSAELILRARIEKYNELIDNIEKADWEGYDAEISITQLIKKFRDI